MYEADSDRALTIYVRTVLPEMTKIEACFLLQRVTFRYTTHKFLGHAIELRCKFFHCFVFAGNFTSLSTVQSYLCGD